MIIQEAIRIDHPAPSAEDAILAAGEALQQSAACTPEYVLAMLTSYQEFGPYFVLAPGLAMPHARPEQGALKAQLSLIRLATPVTFGHPEHDPVQIVLGLSATSSDHHLHLIQRLVTLLGEEQHLHTLMHSRDVQQLYQLFTTTR